jgi:heme-degrading monooxygenase HmoA
MYAAVSTFTLKPGSVSWDTLERVAPQQAALFKSQPGCKSVAIVRTSEDKFVLMQVWDTEHHLEDSRKATMGKGPMSAAQLGDVVLRRESVQGDVIAS